jgi:hypothetical protein
MSWKSLSEIHERNKVLNIQHALEEKLKKLNGKGKVGTGTMLVWHLWLKARLAARAQAWGRWKSVHEHRAKCEGRAATMIFTALETYTHRSCQGVLLHW